MTTGEARFLVRLTPRAGRDRVDGVGDDGVLRVRVAAAPVDDLANRAVIRLLAAELGVPASAVRIIAGSSARRKLIAVDGASRAMLEARWPGLGRD